ncbi:VTT domain-containing protein [Pyrodictium abyssi]|uniref:VTT domain-containing protein n=2 Tax=Pyrodictium abyssi TaxID=54256 RepID=A0ABM8IY10_9CREN|nr:VTT domain-containing protein [Pyrodictium abyssi]
MWSEMPDILNATAAFFADYGTIVGAFFIALVSNAIPYMTVPYLIIIAGYGAALTNTLDKLLVAIAGGVGAGLGKVVVYLLGRGVHSILPEHTRENVELFAKAFRRGVFIAVFLFAALPLPDDILYIPVGMTGYSPVLFFIAVTLGKIVITSLAVLFGDVVASLVGSGQGGFDPRVVAGLIIGSIIVTIIVARMNWKRVIEVYNEEGPVLALVEMIKQVFLAMLPSSAAKKVESKIDSLIDSLVRALRSR